MLGAQTYYNVHTYPHQPVCVKLSSSRCRVAGQTLHYHNRQARLSFSWINNYLYLLTQENWTFTELLCSHCTTGNYLKIWLPLLAHYRLDSHLRCSGIRMATGFIKVSRSATTSEHTVHKILSCDIMEKMLVLDKSLYLRSDFYCSSPDPMCKLLTHTRTYSETCRCVSHDQFLILLYADFTPATFCLRSFVSFYFPCVPRVG